MKVDDGDYRKAQRKLESLENMVSEHALAGSPTLHRRLHDLERKKVDPRRVLPCDCLLPRVTCVEQGPWIVGLASLAAALRQGRKL